MHDQQSSNQHAAEADQARRDFLKKGALAAGVAIAPGVMLMGGAQARPADQPATSANRWGLLIDTRKCKSDCDACVAACATENGLHGHHARAEQTVQWIRKVEVKDKSSGFAASLPVMCQHCAEPPCVDVCPTGASMKRADGIVLVDKHICIGCRYCMMACPYKARSFNHEHTTGQKEYSPRGQGTVEACTLCVHRVDAGGIPACAEACPSGAITFGDLNDPESEISRKVRAEASTQIRADFGLNPGVRYQGI
ncbi:sulfate reduction electron transfer complex DsrMKJOP subunit DsrO [Endothiovibrio diazotrophicus]